MYGIYGRWVLPVLSTGRTTTTGEGEGASPRQQTCPLRQGCVALGTGDQRAPPDESLGSVKLCMTPFGVEFFGGEGHLGGLIYLEDGGVPKFHSAYLGFLVRAAKGT